MILFLVEHPGREMHIAQKLSRKMANLFADEVTVANINFVSYDLFVLKNIRLIVAPGDNKIVNILRMVCGCPVLLLNYEQMLSEINRKLKIIKLEPRLFDKYVAWSEEYKRFLEEQGVPANCILLTDRPQNELASDMFFVPDEMKIFLSAVPVYSESMSLVFIPLTCIQAFKSDSELIRLSRYTKTDLLKLYKRKKFVRLTLLKYYQYLSAQCDNVIYIVRPHPSITSDMHYQFIKEANLTLPNNVLITSEFSPYQWMARAALVVTNYSSLALDASWLGRTAVLVNPFDMPSFMKYAWFGCFKEYSQMSDALSDLNTVGTNYFNNDSTKFTNNVLEDLELNVDNFRHLYGINLLDRPISLFDGRLLANAFRRTKVAINNKLKTGIYADYFKPYRVTPDYGM